MNYKKMTAKGIVLHMLADGVITKEQAGRYFPEFIESESERIRKGIIDCVKGNMPDNSSRKKYIAWLEERAEQKLQDKSTLKTTNKPKFKVGDWIVDKSGFVQQVLDFRYGIYTCSHNSFSIDCESNYHLWTVEDIKDCDVLYMDNGLSTCTFIYKSINKGIIQKYASYNKFGFEGEHYLVLNSGRICPATKEQCDDLFKAMVDAGYEWDSKKKELRKIEQNNWKPTDEQLKALEWQVDNTSKENWKYKASKELLEQLRKLSL